MGPWIKMIAKVSLFVFGVAGFMIWTAENMAPIFLLVPISFCFLSMFLVALAVKE